MVRYSGRELRTVARVSSKTKGIVPLHADKRLAALFDHSSPKTFVCILNAKMVMDEDGLHTWRCDRFLSIRFSGLR